jgi:hypothetical protein
MVQVTKPVILRETDPKTHACEEDARNELAFHHFTVHPELTERQMRANLFRLFNLIRKGISPASAHRLADGLEMLLPKTDETLLPKTDETLLPKTDEMMLPKTNKGAVPAAKLMPELRETLRKLKSFAVKCVKRAELRPLAAVLREQMPLYIDRLEPLITAMSVPGEMTLFFRYFSLKMTRALDAMTEYVDRYGWDEDFLAESWSEIAQAEARFRDAAAATNLVPQGVLVSHALELCRIARDAALRKFNADIKLPHMPYLSRENIHRIASKVEETYAEQGIVVLGAYVSQLLGAFQKVTEPPIRVTAEEFSTMIRYIADLDADILANRDITDAVRRVGNLFGTPPVETHDQQMDEDVSDLQVDADEDDSESSMDEIEIAIDKGEMEWSLQPVLTYDQLRTLYGKLIANQAVCQSKLTVAFIAEIQDRLAKSIYADSETIRFKRFARRLECYRQVRLSDGVQDFDDAAAARFVVYPIKGGRRFTYLTDGMDLYFEPQSVARLDRAQLTAKLQPIVKLAVVDYALQLTDLQPLTVFMETVETLADDIDEASFETFITQLRRFEYDLEQGTWLLLKPLKTMLATLNLDISVRKPASGKPQPDRERLQALTGDFIDAYQSLTASDKLLRSRFDALQTYAMSCDTTRDIRLWKFVKNLDKILCVGDGNPIKVNPLESSAKLRDTADLVSSIAQYFILSTNGRRLNKATLFEQVDQLVHYAHSVDELSSVAAAVRRFLADVSYLEDDVDLSVEEFYELVADVDKIRDYATGPICYAALRIGALKRVYFAEQYPQQRLSFVRPPKTPLTSKFNDIICDKLRALRSSADLENFDTMHFATRVYFFAKGAQNLSSEDIKVREILTRLDQLVEYLRRLRGPFTRSKINDLILRVEEHLAV